MTALATLPDIAQFALWGDSLTDGTYLDHATAQGGLGNWAEQLAEEIAHYLGRPVLSTGFIGQLSTQQWARTGTHKTAYSTAVAAGSAGQHANALTGGVLNVKRSSGMATSGTLVLSNGIATCVLTYTSRPSTTSFGGVTFTSGTDFVLAVGNVVAIGNAGTAATFINMAPQGIGFFADAGATSVATFTRPSYWRTNVGVAVYFVDYSGGGNWQYRIDGGTWTNHGQTLLHNDRIVKFYLASSVTSTIEFRAYDGASSAGMFVLGVELFYVDARAAGVQGVIVHNFGINGWTINDSACVTTTGDRFAILDSVAAGTGSPISNTPNCGNIEMFLANDYGFANTTGYGADITTFYNRTASLGPVAIWTPHELGGGTGTAQATYRSTAASTAASLGALYHDFFADFQGVGFGGVAAQATALQAAGLLEDFIHFSQAGHTEIGSRATWVVIDQHLGAVAPPAMRIFRVGSSNVGGLDVLGGMAGAERRITDSALGSSSVARTAAHPRPLTDSALGGSSIGRTVLHPRSAADSALGSSSVARTVAMSRAITDAALGTSAVARTEGDPRPATDTALGSSSIARTVAVARALTDAALGTSSVARTAADPRPVTDTALGASSVARTAALARPLTDSALGGTALARTVAAARALTDAALGTDAVARAGADPRPLTDVGLGGDSTATTTAAGRQLIDQALGSSAVARVVAGSRALTDVALGGTTLGRTWTASRTLTDQGIGSSSVARTWAGSRSAADTVLGSSSVSAFLAGPGSIFRSVGDQALGSSVVARTWAGSRSLADAALGTSTVGRTGAPARAIADTALGTSTVARGQARARSLTDAMSPQLVPDGTDGIVTGGVASVFTTIAGTFNYGVDYNAGPTVAIVAGVLVTWGYGAYFGITGSSLPRIDLICVTDFADCAVVFGTPAVSPVEPALPAGYVLVASAFVVANATDPSGVTLTDRRTYASYRRTRDSRPTLTDAALGGSSVVTRRGRSVTDTALGSGSLAVHAVVTYTLTDHALGGSAVIVSGGAIPPDLSNAFTAGPSGTQVAWQARETRTSIDSRSTVNH